MSFGKVQRRTASLLTAGVLVAGCKPAAGNEAVPTPAGVDGRRMGFERMPHQTEPKGLRVVGPLKDLFKTAVEGTGGALLLQYEGISPTNLDFYPHHLSRGHVQLIGRSATHDGSYVRAVFDDYEPGAANYRNSQHIEKLAIGVPGGRLVIDRTHAGNYRLTDEIYNRRDGRWENVAVTDTAHLQKPQDTLEAEAKAANISWDFSYAGRP